MLLSIYAAVYMLHRTLVWVAVKHAAISIAQIRKLQRNTLEARNRRAQVEEQVPLPPPMAAGSTTPARQQPSAKERVPLHNRPPAPQGTGQLSSARDDDAAVHMCTYL